jgi:hypothetical protein
VQVLSVPFGRDRGVTGTGDRGRFLWLFPLSFGRDKGGEGVVTIRLGDGEEGAEVERERIRGSVAPTLLR